MATVVITINDKDKKLTTDVEFQPPLTDACSNSQTMALRLLNYMGGDRIYADRSRVSVIHYLTQDLERSVRHDSAVPGRDQQ